MSTRPLGGLVLLGALTVLWGSNWPAMKLALRELDPWTFRTICLLVGGGGLLALVRVGGQSLRVPRPERGPLAVVAFFNITAWHLCSAYGLTLVQAGRAVIIAYTMPLWTVIFARAAGGRADHASASGGARPRAGRHGRAHCARGGQALARPGRRPADAGGGRRVGLRHRVDQGPDAGRSRRPS